jgi:hypothetical protein
MRRDSIKEFLREVIPNTPLKDIGEWVSAPCPLAPWTHANGTDSNPSFGVKVNETDHSVFNCLTCHRKGTLTRLLELLSRFTGDSFDGLIGDAETEEFLGGELPEWGRRVSYDTTNEILGDPVGEEYLDVYDTAYDHWYLMDRGVGPKTAEALDLRVDPDNKGEERILFPVYSPTGEFYGYTGRSVEQDTVLRVRDYFGLRKRLLLLGAEFIEPKEDPYILVAEGLFDFAKLFSWGLPVVAGMHSGVTDAQARILKDFGLPVYSFQDNDQGGRDGTASIKAKMGNHVPVMQVRYPRREVWDEKAGEYRQVGDPNELTKAEALEMIENARLA